MMISTKGRINNILEGIEKISQGEEIVVAFSGGLDSTVVSALAVQALGREKVEYDSGLANVKIVVPLNKNIGLVNVSPLPKEKLKGKIIKGLKKVKTLEQVEFLDKPIKLIIKANKGQFDNQHSRYWLEKGRLQPDFSVPIEVEWLLTTNKSLSTFQVIDYQTVG